LRKEAELWIKQALKDLELAEKNFEIEGYYIVAFLCHQSLEKALKGLYILKHKRLPGKNTLFSFFRERIKRSERISFYFKGAYSRFCNFKISRCYWRNSIRNL